MFLFSEFNVSARLLLLSVIIIGLVFSRDTMLKLWDADTGREMRSMGGHTGTIAGFHMTSLNFKLQNY